MRDRTLPQPYVPGQAVPTSADDFRRWISEELRRVATALSETADGSSFVGYGVPSFAAPKGSTYQRRDGAAGTCFYVNEDGTSAGWVAK